MIAAAALNAAAAAAEPADPYAKVWPSVETVNAQLYYDVRLLDVDPRGVTFRHRNGIAKLPFERFMGDFRSQFLKLEQQWEEARAAEAPKGPAKVDNFPAYQPTTSYIIIHIKHPTCPPPTPCGWGPAPIHTYPPTANLPCNMLTWREKSLRNLFQVQSSIRLRPFGANFRRFIH